MGDGGRLAKSWCGELEEAGNLANDDEFAMKDFHIKFSGSHTVIQIAFS